MIWDIDPVIKAIENIDEIPVNIDTDTMEQNSESEQNSEDEQNSRSDQESKETEDQIIFDNRSENQELELRNLETPNNQDVYIDGIKEELGSDELSVTNTKEMVKNENPFYCPHCEKTFPHFSRLKRHMVVCRIATGKDGPFLCPHCEKSFPHFSRLKRHMLACRIGTGKNEPHFCPNCGKSFPLQSRLKRHLPVCPVTKEKPIHSCSHCGKIFPYASRLKRHLEKIHNEFELNPGIVGSELDYGNQYPVILEDQYGNMGC